MSDFETRSRRAAAAMRRQAESIADIDAALSQIQEGSTVTALDTHDRRRWRRPLLAVGALAVGAAAALIGIAVIDDGEAIVEPPATNPPTPTTQVPTPSTAPVTAPPSTVPPSTDVPPTTRPEDWVPTQPPPPEPPAGGRVPYVIVSQAGDSDQRYRTGAEWQLAIEPAIYVQAFATADRSERLFVNTQPRPETIVEPIPGTIGPWDLFDGGGVFPGLDLATDDIAVFIDTNSETLDLRQVAEQLGPRPDGEPGWDVGGLPAGFEPAGEGYWWSGDARDDVVLDGEGRPRSQVEVWFGTEGMGENVVPYLYELPTQVVDVDGTPGLFIDVLGPDAPDPKSQLQWELEPGVYVRLTVAGEWTSDELIEYANTAVERRTRQFWEQQPILPDGCQAFNC